MLLDSLLAKVFYKLFAIFFSLYCTITGTTIATPSTEDIIKADPDANLSFAIIADPQVGNYQLGRYAYFMGGAKDLRNSEGLDALLIAGDIAENGLAVEYQLFYDELGDLGLRYIACEGNHDIRLRLYSQSLKRFNGFVNELNGDEDAVSFHHSEMLNGYKFIVLGSDRTEFEENYLSDEQLEWLDEELASCENTPTFVMVHQPLKDTHGLPDVWNSPIDSAGSIGNQSDALKEILLSHKNVIFISGHEHTGFGEYTYERISDGDRYFDSVCLPSFSVNNKDGSENGHCLGYIAEVYDDSVQFRARDMLNGKWLPDYDIELPVEGILR